MLDVSIKRKKRNSINSIEIPRYFLENHDGRLVMANKGEAKGIKDCKDFDFHKHTCDYVAKCKDNRGTYKSTSIPLDDMVFKRREKLVFCYQYGKDCHGR